MRLKEIKSYIKEIKKYTVCKNANTRRMLEDIEASVCDYIEESPFSTMADIKAHFGEPKFVADSINSGLGENDVEKYKFGRSFAITVIAIITAIFLCFGAIEIIVSLTRYTGRVDPKDVVITYTEG